MTKQNKRVAKKKTELDNLRTYVQAPAADSAALLSSCPRSPTYLLSFPTSSGTPTALLSCLVPASVPRSLAILLLFAVLGPTSPHLVSTALRTFKQALSDKPLRGSTSPIEPFCLFLPLRFLPNKTNHKQTFDIVFINSHPLTSNHA